MDEPSLIGSVPGVFSFLGDLLFRWVPASVLAVLDTSSSSPITNLTEPVAVWDVPTLLQQSAGTAGYESLVSGWLIFSMISLALSLPFLALTVYCWIRIAQIRRREYRAVAAAQRTVESKDILRTQLRWNRVLEQASSSDPEKWRLAILEADIMLSELLDLQGYRGETMADKMKQVNAAQFNSINDAWEAHKVRNRVAHESTSLDLTPREVRNVILLYERVFREFRYIE